MPKYMFQTRFTPDGVKGVLAKGGSARRAAAEAAVKSVGGTLEAFYFAFGDTDAFVIVDLPDHASAAAVALTVSGSGAIALRTTVLLTPEELDAAAKRKVAYTPPGG
jgi:uncharacterized protein with GYD domain